MPHAGNRTGCISSCARRARTDAPTPLVLMVHGGPWARDFWGFTPTAQWFANRGYATLQVNYRAHDGIVGCAAEVVERFCGWFAARH